MAEVVRNGVIEKTEVVLSVAAAFDSIELVILDRILDPDVEIVGGGDAVDLDAQVVQHDPLLDVPIRLEFGRFVVHTGLL